MNLLPYAVAAWLFLIGLYAIVTSRNSLAPLVATEAAGGVPTRADGRRSPPVRRGSRVRLAAAFAVAALVAGTGLLVFADPAWAHAIGAVALIACAVTVFGLASAPTGELRGRPC